MLEMNDQATLEDLANRVNVLESTVLRLAEQLKHEHEDLERLREVAEHDHEDLEKLKGSHVVSSLPKPTHAASPTRPVGL